MSHQATLALMMVATVYLAIPLLPLFVVYYFMQQLYLRTSRELKRLESISRSPVYTHFSETMTGYGNGSMVMRKNYHFDASATLASVRFVRTSARKCS